jgi:hypothetical protein
LGQKQYPSALVHYLAAVRAEVFQCSFLLLSSTRVLQLGSGFGRTIFKFPNIAKPYRYTQPVGTLQTSTDSARNWLLILSSQLKFLTELNEK